MSVMNISQDNCILIEKIASLGCDKVMEILNQEENNIPVSQFKQIEQPDIDIIVKELRDLMDIQVLVKNSRGKK